MMIIQGVVQMTMAPMKAFTLPSRSKASRPTRMKTKASAPMNSDACTRLQPREHRREVQPGAVQRGDAGRHAAEERHDDQQQGVPQRRDLDQRDDVVGLAGDEGGGADAEQERHERGQLAEERGRRAAGTSASSAGM